jgi:hypothetical protein
MISANFVAQQELRAEIGLSQEDCVRILLIGALVATSVGCSHQPSPWRATTDSCASRNPLACWMSVRVSIEPAPPATQFRGTTKP